MSMTETGLRATVLRTSAVYRLWQSPQKAKKLLPFLRHNDVASMRRVLDVACGPGSNSALFTHTEYTGVDINEDYIAHARRRYPGRFLVADVTTWTVPPEERFDCVLANSFFHHVDDGAGRRILAQLREVLAGDGHLHVVDLVLPARRGLARLLARLDRGEFPRSLEACRELFAEHYEPVVFESYALKILGVKLWEMVYFKGKPR